ncbi:MAG: Qat anti-phage system QueC-like protein QatC [Janthinobacterium lividum]
MTRLIFHAHGDDVPAVSDPTEIHVLLYGSRPEWPGTGSIGNQLKKACGRLGHEVQTRAFDFLTIALAVTAADTFVSRDSADDRWSRSFHLTIPLVRPDNWEPVKSDLQRTLRFLSGDDWLLDFVGDGPVPPSRDVRKREKHLIDLSSVDCASLFSGGLDSAIGVTELLSEGRRPLLVSHAYAKDRTYQASISRSLPRPCPMFLANAYPTWDGVDEDSMRTRSFNFLAYGAVAAAAIAGFHRQSKVTLFVPENGTIAINAPLTLRRIGSHSTRTTHPFFLQSVQEIFDRVGIPVEIENRYRNLTKGEMLARVANEPAVRDMAVKTVSCGKWKRHDMQCGRCLPCMIRRASFFKANVQDTTTYEYPDLSDVLKDEDGRDDLVSIFAALKRPRTRGESWILQAGPLPNDPGEREEAFDVVRRGMTELECFLTDQGFA